MNIYLEVYLEPSSPLQPWLIKLNLRSLVYNGDLHKDNKLHFLQRACMRIFGNLLSETHAPNLIQPKNTRLGMCGIAKVKTKRIVLYLVNVYVLRQFDFGNRVKDPILVQLCQIGINRPSILWGIFFLIEPLQLGWMS